MIRVAMARRVCFSSAIAACWAVWSWCLPPATAYGQAGLAVYTMNADGSDVKRIYHADNSSVGSPTWSHDGKKIAFDGGTHQAGFEAAHIFVLSLGEAVLV